MPPHRAAVCALVALAAHACTAAPARTPIEVPCRPPQASPYASGTPYLGVHANPENDDVIACRSGSAFVEVWHALEGLGMSQPNTFSPDGEITYAATFNPDPDGCNVWALRTTDGSVAWCRTLPRSVGGSAIEVDEDGNLYATAERWVISLDASGEERWRAEVGSAAKSGEFGDGPLGVHFTRAGFAATVTNQGVVHLISRADGASVASLDLAATYGFVAPEPFMAPGGANLRDLLPDEVNRDLDAVFGAGGGGAGIGAFLGAGGGFSDNTIGVSRSRDELYVVGGGPDPMHGALMQLRIGGSASAPTLEAGWALITTAGSATSPSITQDGQNVLALPSPRTAMGRMLVADVDACDANTDADPDPARCAPAWETRLERGPIAGSPPILPDGTLALWELSVSQGVFDAAARDVAVVGPEGPIWEATLPDALEWTAVITVTENHFIGTASFITRGPERVVSVNLPGTVDTWLVGLDRATGALAFREPVTDDASATVTIGPDGALYVGMFGLLTILATEDTPTLGLIRFSPTAP